MIKYTILTLTLLFIPTNAVASSSPEQIEFCGVLEKLATKVMTARQNAMPMSSSMEVFSGNTAIDEMGRAMIKDAYAEPHWQSYKLKQITINNFATKWAGICYSVDRN